MYLFNKQLGMKESICKSYVKKRVDIIGCSRSLMASYIYSTGSSGMTESICKSHLK